ncbi:hypothetical protein MMC13_004738 [Lambiella insularis]|nr:hypothetical protein [Lambiella insularis]
MGPPSAPAPAPAPAAGPTSIWTRKRDLFYLCFFAVHIAVMLLVDLTPLYPAALKPAVLMRLRAWYVTTYHDQFFTAPPAWFEAYMWLEAGYHLPLSVWVVGALGRDDPLVPIHLLVYSVQTAMTTLTCIVDYMSWNVGLKTKMDLGALYGPYLLLSLGMGYDMFGRLKQKVLSSERSLRQKSP